MFSISSMVLILVNIGASVIYGSQWNLLGTSFVILTNHEVLHLSCRKKHHHQENMASIKGRILFVTRFVYVTSLTVDLSFTHDPWKLHYRANIACATPCSQIRSITSCYLFHTHLPKRAGNMAHLIRWHSIRLPQPNGSVLWSKLGTGTVVMIIMVLLLANNITV